jgi:hypothetical protein
MVLLKAMLLIGAAEVLVEPGGVWTMLPLHVTSVHVNPLPV